MIGKGVVDGVTGVYGTKVADMIDPVAIACAFAGGIFGAAFGGCAAIILCGAVVLVGTGISAATGDVFLLSKIAWGPFLGPHVAFAGAVAAAAYAGRRGMLAHGRDVGSGLLGLDAPAVLLVGGAFGLVGHLAKLLLDLVPASGVWSCPNSVTLSIVINAAITRVVFGRTGLWGKVCPGGNRWLPTESACWLPWQSRPGQLLVIAVGVALPVAAIIVQRPVLAGFGFGIGALSLLFLLLGARTPVIFHIALAAEGVAAATGNIWWGLTFGIAASFLGELCSCLFLIHGDTHFDPPATALVILSILQLLLGASGVLHLPGAAVPAASAAVVAAGGTLLLQFLRRSGGETQGSAH
jgi:hypothetical protein